MMIRGKGRFILLGACTLLFASFCIAAEDVWTEVKSPNFVVISTSFSSLNRVKEAIRRFIKERLTEQDMVALATSGQTLGVAQQFSRDRQLLNYAIEQIRLGPLRQESLYTPDLAVAVLAGHQSGNQY